MKLLEIITALENKGNEKVFRIILNDGIVLLLRMLFFFMVIYIGKKIIEFLLNRLDGVPSTKLGVGAKQFTKSFVRLGLYVILFLLGLLIFGFNEHSIFTMISAIGFL